jgi:hypothetical protein
MMLPSQPSLPQGILIASRLPKSTIFGHKVVYLHASSSSSSSPWFAHPHHHHHHLGDGLKACKVLKVVMMMLPSQLSGGISVARCPEVSQFWVSIFELDPS